MLRHNLWHALNTVWQLNLEAVSLHAYTSLPATPLADGHDRGDRRHDPMRGLGNAGQYAAAPHRDGDGAGRQRLRGGRQALPFRAREVRRGGATSLDRWFGKALRDPRSGVSVGLMQGGVVGAASTPGLESLG